MRFSFPYKFNLKLAFVGCSLLITKFCLSQTSSLVSLSPTGKLVYTADAKGNRIPDFSGVGYMNSEVPVPDIPVVLTIAPVAGDNLNNIQNAINQVAAMTPDANGFRGAILLQAGTYNVSNTININTSGIVLKGVGYNGNGTNIIATSPFQYTLFNFEGSNGTSTIGSSKKSITDAYVPFGSHTVNVASGHSFAVNDRVMLHRIPKQSWIDLLTMAQWGWTVSGYDVYYERKVTKVNGNAITLDAPVMDMIDTAYATGELVKYNSSRIEKCGIENMRLSSYYASETDENHGWTAVAFDNIVHSWARNLEVYYFGFSAVDMRGGASWITVDSCKMYDAKSTLDGGRRYSFFIDGQRNLVKNCTTRRGRHDFIMSSIAAGPNVFYNCTATLQQNDIGPHHRWSTGTLFDNITGNGNMNVQNRTNSGTGHGWTAAQTMYWNCTAAKMIIQDPQGDHINWAIGCKAPVITNVGDFTTEPLGFVESQGIPIAAIPSLFMKQLEERLNALLPVTLSGFTVSKQNNNILLAWSTASEINNKIFVIEHATDGIHFKTIGTVKAASNISQTNNYSFVHINPGYGTHFYRLKQVDADGQYTYSPIRIINNAAQGISLQSNIINSELIVHAEIEKTISAAIINSNGQIIRTINIQPGTNSYALPNMPSGIYFIKTDNTITIRFIKQ